MASNRTENRKFIIGWLTLKPGRGAEFAEMIRPYVAGCREEDGCVFFEMNASLDNPDVFVVAECFRDEAAHEAHLKRPLFLEFWKRLDGMAVEGRFENIYPAAVVSDSADFMNQS